MGNGGIKIELTIDEVNIILFALAERPYKDVFQVIEKIKAQAEPQVSDSSFYKELPGMKNPV